MKHTMKLVLALLLAVLLALPTFVLAEDDGIVPESADVTEEIEAMEAEADTLEEVDAGEETVAVPETTLLEEDASDEAGNAPFDDGAVFGEVLAEADAAGAEELTLDLSEAMDDPPEIPAEASGDAEMPAEGSDLPMDGASIDGDTDNLDADADEPDEPTGESDEPTGEPGETAGEPDGPTGESDEPTGEPTDEPGEPTDEPDEPTDEPGETGEPTDEAAEPMGETGEPTGEAGEPTDEPGEPAEESAEAQPVRVTFEGKPETAAVEVYPAPAEPEAEADAGTEAQAGGEAPEAIAPEPDGSFLLLPGEYAYSASAEGYAPVAGVSFTVPEGGEALTVAYALEEAPGVAEAPSVAEALDTAEAPGVAKADTVTLEWTDHTGTEYRQECAVVTGGTMALDEGFYAVTGNITAPAIAVNGSVWLVLADGASLTVTNGFNLGDGATLNVAASGEAGSGKLAAVFSGDQGDLVIEGGEITANGSVEGIECQDLAVYGGNLTATGSVYGISAASSVTIGGKAEKVTASGGNHGILAENGSVVIQSGTVDATGGAFTGIDASGSVTIGGKAEKVTATGGYVGIESNNSSVDIQGGEVEATGTASVGISASVSVTIGEKAKKVTATGRSYGIWAGSVAIQGGEVVATGTDIGITYGIYTDTGSVTIGEKAKKVTATGGSFGIWAGSVAIQGGTVEAKAKAISKLSYGIWAESGSVTIGEKAKEVTASGDDCGIWANGSIDIQGGTVEAEATGTGGYGIYARGGVTIGEKAKKVTASGENRGIWTNGSIDIQGGTVEAKATGTDSFCYGIYADGNVIIGEDVEKLTATGGSLGICAGTAVGIQGGTVVATGTSGYGISAASSVTIGEKAEKVTATGGDYGILGGAVDILGGTVVATGTSGRGISAASSVTIGENAEKVTATGGYYGILGGAIDIQGGTVVATGTLSCGIDASGGVTIGEKAKKVTASGDKHAISSSPFQLFDRAKVNAGESESGATLIPYTPDPDSRVAACLDSNNKYARIEPCDHPGEGSCTITKDTHTIHCAYCATPAGDEAHFFGADGEGECVCGAWNVSYLDPVSGAMQGPVFCLPAGESMAGGGVSEGWYASGRSASFEDRLIVDGTVNLILCDGATLEAKQGVDVDWLDKLIVWAQSDGSGMGALNADGGSEAGIGNNTSAGIITINGGAVTGTSSGGCAGIGGAGGEITINGGRVTGECTGTSGAGIGGLDAVITINGGIVSGTSAGTGYGAGIGSIEAFACNIKITGGTVTGESKSFGAGIGGGYRNRDGLMIDISGGTVTGKSEVGAGIGSGLSGEGGTIRISGGGVNGKGAGIGSGLGAQGDSTVTLDWSADTCEDMSVTATGYLGAVTLNKPFKNKADGSEVYSGDIADLAALAGKTLVPNMVLPESVTLEPAAAKLPVGDTLALTATFQPDGSISKLTWTSSDDGVATVDDNGIVTAQSAGKATITATAQNGKTATCEVTVYAAPTGIAVSPATVKLLVGRTKALTATVRGEDADPAVNWKSSNTKVAAVDKNGKVTAKAAGKATITATTVNGLSAKCAVTVYRAPTGVKLTPAKKTLRVKQTLKLKAAVKGRNAYPAVTWTSSNPKVAKVSKKGVVTALKPGKATITVKTVNGKKAKCVITVTKSPSGTIQFD